MEGHRWLFMWCCCALMHTVVGFRFQFQRMLSIDTGGVTGHSIPLCSEHIPESATAATVCWSSCSETPSKATCNGQAETWQYLLSVPSMPFKAASPGYERCALSERRFLCSLSKTTNPECTENGAASMRSGEVCYTACGVPSCPVGDFDELVPREDFKYMGCEGGAHRTRCRKRIQIESLTENPLVKPQSLPVE
ncbi:hypothetical protein TGME49_232700 [Toxoplasma gondii ME49]|uniref:Secreted protein n=14 Tax=Toxoplasma gondii TaxID=5811 RepID=A0A125YMF7_TOXGV|nr:hypothetical protein TGME49_232700 [Toxoplasma gondii ME49]EPR64335.1 hypothetical protein TGGT1_232700 [Toxoplasma gondii GT1]ESS35798.1 hypothetical protein TGVEG_232700 [Toxoplasma gondii VEG]KAF4641867.1 hypothetical protein TGRH88_076790 [Toxoplasma gondii]KFG48747.1 hypothetical protein TGDOM2_232700 [Toxoplasma gondii GAB2-2007-GAL-DOM2]KFG51239.1 hypothetical protein TGP89_232700 [Toxoplasma gondii p89]KFG55256.1 hypothetical protein TGFOU_232700 [Toxoplasma gondii FOU]KFG63812.1 |eukprot:XP_018636806.1 hypothetical protein TGME49_232700 [Toxoplasma gondii ME49]